MLLKIARAAVVLVGALSVAARTGEAQEAPHRGFWISFGLGGGWNTTENADGEVQPGGGAYLRMGGTTSQKLLLGGEAIGWAREEGNSTLSRGNAAFTALFYPARRGLYLKGGVGVASVSLEESSGAITVTETHGGFGATVGVGYDLRLGRNFFLSPNVDFLFQKIEGAENTILLLTIGATWH